jgi:hypothetical protein
MSESQAAFECWASEIGLNQPAYAVEIPIAREAFLAGAMWASEWMANATRESENKSLREANPLSKERVMRIEKPKE